MAEKQGSPLKSTTIAIERSHSVESRHAQVRVEVSGNEVQAEAVAEFFALICQVVDDHEDQRPSLGERVP